VVDRARDGEDLQAQEGIYRLVVRLVVVVAAVVLFLKYVIEYLFAERRLRLYQALGSWTFKQRIRATIIMP
jgi:hypothetical protein